MVRITEKVVCPVLPLPDSSRSLSPTCLVESQDRAFAGSVNYGKIALDELEGNNTYSAC